jgi:hypothetical protein
MENESTPFPGVSDELISSHMKPYVPRHKREDAPDVKVRLTLSDIEQNALAIQDLLFDSVGELTPELEQALDDLLSCGSATLDAAAWVVRKLTGEAETCKAEAARYKARAEALERNVEHLKGRMLAVVDTAFSGKLRTAQNSIWGQNSATHTSFDVAPDADLEMLAKESPGLVRRRFELDKIECKARLDEGRTLPQSIVVTHNPPKRSLRIR